MPFKSCLHCEKELVLKCTRDLTRKKYCSRSCRQKHRFLIEPTFQEIFKKARTLCNTPEANKKKGHKGEKNPRYLKDRTQLKTRKRYENSEWRKAVFARDNYTCQDCGQIGGRLQADHIKPYCAFPELRTDINNGRTLCVSCHKKTDTYGAGAWKYKETAYSV